MLRLLLFMISFLLLSSASFSQIVTGRIIDENGDGIGAVPLKLYSIEYGIKYAETDLEGNFTIELIVGVEDEELPLGYAISNNYPNPFNPKTRIAVSLPDRGKVGVSVFNLLGEKVITDIEEDFSAGINYLDLELIGLSNGIYFARISIDNKYSVTRKMMLVYGTQHLSEGGINSQIGLNKFNSGTETLIQTPLDSLVAESPIIPRKVFTDLPDITGSTLDLGELIIERYCPGTPTLTYEGKTYNTVQIGDQCWLKENLDVGTMIESNSSGFLQTNNGVIEKYCYDNNPANCETYGGFYEWPEAMQYSTTPGTQGICPTGWHILTLAEFETLESSVGGDGNALKAIGQGTGSGAGTNTSGFSALLAGSRSYSGYFLNLGSFAVFWSSTEDDSGSAYGMRLLDDNSVIVLYSGSKGGGCSIRCLQD